MTCTPDALFAAAKAVQKIASDEALYRGATNRLYYASYHCCRLYNASLPPTPVRGSGVHEQLINWLTFPSEDLTKNGVQRAKAIGKALRALCTLRAAADYDVDAEFSKEKMEQACQSAEMIFAGTKVKKGLLDDKQAAQQQA